MTRKQKSQVVWEIERTTSETIWSGRATVSLTLRTVGDENRWSNSRTDIRATAYNGDGFGGDVEFVIGLGGSKIEELRTELDMIASFNGRSDAITVDSVRRGLRRCEEGFYDRRMNSWQPISNAKLDVYTPELSWYDDDMNMEELEDLRNIYADDEESAQEFVANELMARSRLDVLKAWGWRGMSVYGHGMHHDLPTATSLGGLFDIAPDKLPEPDPEPEKVDLESIKPEMIDLTEPEEVEEVEV